ncbi:conserved hypothetical protein [Gloeothece citriformis PCC 7424]|uniref:Nucleic acid binding OB-fold tRNA/helicase-type n=1 Tax=Gloeothece citriformis (strain PCC 7424) TaxID=65393 RepID=B7KEP2_GLOC7|nr:hypothetical protein [Gloeothece citriformis]ACK69067.1 conserved hypothetical protein [Gloeothece citriformis PCC 7424]
MFINKLSLKTSLWQGISLPFLVGGLIGCSALTHLGNALPFNTEPVTPIKELTQQNQGSTLYLQGKVTQEAPFLGGGAYQLQDTTGAVWVRTNQSLPQTGTQLMIKGQLDYQSIPVESKELGEIYILELEQVKTSPIPSSEPQPPKPATKPVDDLLLDHKQRQK